MAQVVDDSLEAGREAAQRRAWRDAYDLLKAADEAGRLAAEDIESFGEAAWWTGRLDEAIGLRERAYAAFVAAGEPRRAAMMTVSLAMDYGLRGALSVSGGWIGRGERLLADEPEGVEHGYLSLIRGTNQLDLGELGRAGEAFHRARELGASYGDRSLETTALVFEGAIRVWTGDVTDGLAILDEATAAATSGELIRSPPGSSTASRSTRARPSATAAGQRSGPRRRTAGATASTSPASRAPAGSIAPRSFASAGDWPQAEQQAVQACEELHDFDRVITAAGTTRSARSVVGTVTSPPPKRPIPRPTTSDATPNPALSLLRLAEGKIDAAVAAITRDAPGRDSDPLAARGAFRPQIEIAIAAGKIRRARERPTSSSRSSTTTWSRTAERRLSTPP